MGCFVKICGVARGDDAQAIAELRPDAMGFVFWPRSPRAVAPEAVAEWKLPAHVWKVGVFVDASAEELARAAAVAGLDAVQLHVFQTLEKSAEIFPNIGKITAEVFQTLENISDFLSKHWKTFSSRSVPRLWLAAYLGRIAPPPASAKIDAVVLDHYSPRTPGGTGRTLNWDEAAAFVRASGRPVLLAGGLTPENVAEALRRVRPWGVDVSSGVERAPGQKDLGKVKEFIRICRESEW